MKWRTRLVAALITTGGLLVPASEAMAGIFLANHAETLMEDEQ